MSSTDLAHAVGLASGRQAIQAYECGRVDPKRELIEKLAAALGVKPCWLAGWEE